MKIAILSPDAGARNVSDPRYEFATYLLKDFEATPFDFTLFPVAMGDPKEGTVSLTALKGLYDFFTRVEGFDLIHNLVGLPPLYLNPAPKFPILTTFFEPPHTEGVPLMASPPPLFFFSAIDTVTGVHHGANFLGTITPSKIGDQLPALYKKIDALTRQKDHRPWGYYVVLADEPDHKVKRIVVWPRKRLSLQRHRRRSEHWYVVQGKAIVTLDDRRLPLEAGDSVDIPTRVAHRIQNPDSKEQLVFIEVQRGDYFGEDDIERLEDDYGRA